MKTKKFLTVLLFSLTAALLLVGCGKDTADHKVLRVGSSVDFAPFEFQDEKQTEYQGFDMDLIRALGKEMGREVDIQNMGFDGLIPALTAKNIDVIISGMTITEERKERVAFSDPYYQSGLTMVVRADEQNIKTFKDLEGKKIAVQIGTTSANEVKKIKDAEIVELNTPPDCFIELQNKGVDAVVNDRPVNDYYISTGANGAVKALDERLTAEDYGIAMHKDNKELQQELNAALKKLRENGEYQRIFDKWFGAKK